jgi:hypothetical protein
METSKQSKRFGIAGWVLLGLAVLMALSVWPMASQAGNEPKQEAGVWPPPVPAEARGKPPGLLGPVGPRGDPRRVKTLDITEKGVYENYLVDHEFGKRSEAVRIRADGAVLRNCEIRNGTRDAVGVRAADVLIENCKIHHFLYMTFKDNEDAHGITGQPRRLTIRNCEIYYVSGDCVQFDPARNPWTDVVIENCHFWTGPLPEDAAGFHKGERPGENALDTKLPGKHPRGRVVVRNSVFNGFAKGGPISNMSALNIKESVDVQVDNCIFYDNEIGLRLRGPGKFGGAHVTVQDCFFYYSDIAVRYEDRIEQLKMHNLAFGPKVKREFQRAGGGAGPGFEIIGEREAPSLAEILKQNPQLPANGGK